MPDLDAARMWLMLAPIAAAVLWMGVYPESFLAPMRDDVAVLLDADRAAPRRRGDAQLDRRPAGAGRAAHDAARGGALMDSTTSLA